MGRYHSPFMMVLFPNQKPTGVDLGNVEIKETNGKFECFTVNKIDMRAEFFLFYSWRQNKFWFVDAQDLPLVKKQRTFRVPQIETACIFSTTNVIEMMEKLRPYLTDQSYYSALNEVD